MIKSKLYFDTDEPMETEHSISLIADYDGNEETLFDNTLDPELPILPLRNMVLFPGVVLPVSVGRKSSLRLIKDAFKQEKAIGVFCQRSSETEEPQQKDLYEIGTAARVVRICMVSEPVKMAGFPILFNTVFPFSVHNTYSPFAFLI